MSADVKCYSARLRMNGVLCVAVFGRCCLFAEMPCLALLNTNCNIEQNSKAPIVEPGQVEKVIAGDRNRRVVAATSTNQLGLEQLDCIGN